MRGISIFFVGCLLSVAHASEPKTVVLEYSTLEQESPCPDEKAFRALVAARLGVEPFRETASLRAKVVFSAVEQQVSGTLTMLDEAGKEIGQRQVEAALSECSTVAQSLAMALALALDPQILMRPARVEVATVSAPVEMKPEALPIAQKPCVESRPENLYSVSVGSAFAIGLMPSPGIGPRMDVGWRREAFSVMLEGTFFPQASLAALGGQINTSLLRGGMSACGHLDAFGMCLRATGGLMRAEGANYLISRRGSVPTATAGPAVFYEQQWANGLRVKGGVSLDLSLIRSTFTLGDTEAWYAPAVGSEAFVTVGFGGQ